MALVDLTKQLAKEALLSAAKDPAPAPQAPAADPLGNVILGQIHAMQKALKEDEELTVWYGSGADRIRVFEIYLPTWKLAVLTGQDSERALCRVISPVDALQLVTRVVKAPAGSKPGRIGLVAPKTRD
ncbi:MAG: hypothetical protein JST11_25730 [Acidobacteria bacterium]|nr:hypothetical protein [Acidobacteriota bacterium]